jgi:putative flippase GtrA
MNAEVNEAERIQRDLAERAAREDAILDLASKEAKAKEARDGRVSIASSQFLRFLVVGGFAAAVNFCSRIVLSLWLPYAPAIVIAYLFGLTTAFLLNRRFVFTGATNRLHHQMFWFVAVNALALAQTLLVSLLFADYLLPRFGISWHAETIAHAIGVVTPVFTSYVGHKRLSFAVRT